MLLINLLCEECCRFFKNSFFWISHAPFEVWDSFFSRSYSSFAAGSFAYSSQYFFGRYPIPFSEMRYSQTGFLSSVRLPGASALSFSWILHRNLPCFSHLCLLYHFRKICYNFIISITASQVVSDIVRIKTHLLCLYTALCQMEVGIFVFQTDRRFYGKFE